VNGGIGYANTDMTKCGNGGVNYSKVDNFYHIGNID
jgi:hypothetical protein